MPRPGKMLLLADLVLQVTPAMEQVSGTVRMSERAAGCNAIADKLLDLFDLGKAAVLLARPDDVAVEPHLEDASCCVGREDDRPELLPNSSCTIQPARRPQPHRRQYVISTAGAAGMTTP